MSRYEALFETLNRGGVRYVVVGGLAVVLHGYARLTLDADIVIDLERSHAEEAMRVFGELGFVPRLPVEAVSFADPQTRATWISEKNMRVFTMIDRADPLHEVDLFVEDPIPFAELHARSVLLPLAGTAVRVASLEDLITMKRQAGRPKDLEDIAALEEIARDE